MKPTKHKQINSAAYWDTLYHTEMGECERVLGGRRRFLMKYLPKKIDRFLDVGCGWGEILDFAKERYKCATYGVDISPDAIEYAEKQHIVRVCNAEKLPYEDGYFDAVWCGETIEHLDHPKKAVEELFRVCKKSGRVIISVPLPEKFPAPEHTFTFSEADFLNLVKDHPLISFKITDSTQQIACWRKK